MYYNVGLVLLNKKSKRQNLFSKMYTERQQGCPYEAENISRKIHTIPNIISSFEPSSTLNCSQSYLQGFSFYNRLYLYLILCFSPIFRALLVSLVSVFDESDIPQLMWHGGLSHMFITARLIFIQKNGKPLLKCFILSLNLKYKKKRTNSYWHITTHVGSQVNFNLQNLQRSHFIQYSTTQN